MSSAEPFGSARAVEMAIKDAAKVAIANDQSQTLNDKIRQAEFDRFLCRVFSDGGQSEWVLKGGTGMLARVSSARTTLDIDLYRNGYDLEEALDDLQRLARLDLGDHFRFEYISHRKILAGIDQQYVDGLQVSFDVFLGVKHRGTLRVDLAAGVSATGRIERLTPKNALPIPRLTRHEYRLYPLVDQVADKVCATLQQYGGRESSRVKDLVDLVVLAVTHDIPGDSLETALRSELARRHLHDIESFSVPNDWGVQYARAAREVPSCGDYQTVDEAARLVSELIDPVLQYQARKHIWVCAERRWRRVDPSQ